jgi:hypothetical protein
MINFFDYGSIVDDLNNKYKLVSYRSICYTPKMPLERFLLKTKILQTERYRPDMISYRLFNDPRLSWVLDELNNLYNFSDYYAGREIKYLDTNGLRFINIDSDYIPYDYDNF